MIDLQKKESRGHHESTKQALKDTQRLKFEMFLVAAVSLWFICLKLGCKLEKRGAGILEVYSAAQDCPYGGHHSASSIRPSERQQNNDARLC